MADNNGNKGLETGKTQVEVFRKYLMDFFFGSGEDILVSEAELEWNDPLASELEKLVSDYVKVMVKDAINQVVESGYDEKTAELLVKKSLYVSGGLEFAAGMVKGGLKLLKNPNAFNYDDKLESLDSLVEFIMVEMVCGVKEVNPYFTVADSLWYLLIFDLNVLSACVKNLDDQDEKGKREILRERALLKGKSYKERLDMGGYNYSYKCKKQSELFEKLVTKKKALNKSSSSSVAGEKNVDPIEMKGLLDMVKVIFDKELQSWYDWTNGKIKQVTYVRKIIKQEMEKRKIVTKQRDEKMKLEAENATLRLHLDSVKLNANEAAVELEIFKLREQEVIKNVESSTLNCQLLQNELSALKRNADDLNRQFEKANARFKQMESLWMKEDAEKERIVSKTKLMQERRKQLEALLQKKMNDMSKRAEIELQVYRERKKELEEKIAGLKCSFKRDRECVMCLDKDKSVIFLPCAHQVICIECNVNHEKRGMDCPSCRATINRRIHPRFANS